MADKEYSLSDLERALINADKAGDTEAARKLANAIRKLRAPQTLDYGRLEMEREYGPTVGMGATKLGLAGAGKAVSDIGLGARQITGFAPQEEVDESRRLDAPLMRTIPGQIGNVGGSAGLQVATGGTLGTIGAAARMPTLATVGTTMLRAPANLPGVVSTGALGAAQGLLQPTAEGESRVTNTLLGGGAGAAVPAMGMTGKGIQATVEPVLSGGREKILGRVLRDASGPQAKQAALNMQNANILVPGSLPTAAEVAQSPGIAAVQRAASAADPEAYATRAAQQNEARLGALHNIVPPGKLEGALKTREKETTALREAALKNANLGTRKTVELEGRLSDKGRSIIDATQQKGQLDTMAAQQGVFAENWTPVPGMPRAPGRYSHNIERAQEARVASAEVGQLARQRKAERDFIQYQLNSLKQAGYSPLNQQGIVESIDSVLNKPGYRASDVATKTLGELKEKIAGLADQRGNLNAQDLYMVRKEIGNTISKYAKEGQNFDKRMTAGLTRDLQKGIDEAISKAGAGDLWTQYLSKYQELSKPINEIEFVQALIDKSVRPLDQQIMPNMYARNLSDELAQSVTGFDKATMQGILSPQVRGALESVKDDLARSEYAKNAGRGVGSDTFQKLSMGNLMQHSGIGGWAMNIPGAGRLGGLIYKEADEKLKQELAQALLDPKKAALLMEKATPTQKEQILSGILRMGGGPLTLGAALTYSGAPQ